VVGEVEGYLTRKLANPVLVAEQGVLRPGCCSEELDELFEIFHALGKMARLSTKRTHGGFIVGVSGHCDELVEVAVTLGSEVLVKQEKLDRKFVKVEAGPDRRPTRICSLWQCRQCDIGEGGELRCVRNMERLSQKAASGVRMEATMEFVCDGRPWIGFAST
jgi:hypothetical protein